MNKPIKVGSDFSGVGAFNQALRRINIDYEELFACDMDKYARKTFIHNYGEPTYYPENVYDRQIPTEPLDIYMTSPPCQAFSLAGKRKGEEDKRGVLFYNSHEFIQKNNPRYFIFENVKGLLSDDGGKTFQRWIDYLGGKSVNGTQTMFPQEESVPYHVYYQVLNAKDYGVPQNRERIFIIGIRDDADNNFNFPKPFELKKRLKDVLEENVDEKYYLSDKMVNCLSSHKSDKFHVNTPLINNTDTARTLRAGYFKMGRQDNYIQVNSATSKGYEIAKVGEDSINFEHPNSKTRRGRVGVGVGQTLTTSCNQGVAIGAIRGRNPENPTSRQSGLPTQQMLEVNENGTSNCLTTVQKDNVVVEFNFNQNDTRKILLELQQEVGAQEIESWGLRIMETIRKKEILRQKLHEERIFKKAKESSNRTNEQIQQVKGSIHVAAVIMRSLSKETWHRCSSQRRKSIKQLIRKFNEGLQVLSHENTSSETDMYSKKLYNESKRIWVLRKTLSEIQKIWGSINNENEQERTGYRIRKLTVRECFRLMDFPDTFDFSVVSDSQAYKQAGNSIVINVIAQIISKFNLPVTNNKKKSYLRRYDRLLDDCTPLGFINN